MLPAGLALLALASCGAPRISDSPAAHASDAANAPVERAQCAGTADYYAANPDAAIWTKNGKLAEKGRELTAVLAQAGETGSGAMRLRSHSELELATAFVDLARKLSAAPAKSQIRYVDEDLRPQGPCPSKLLGAAAQLPSVKPLLERLGAPNLIAERLMRALDAAPDGQAGTQLADDLALARSLGDFRRAIVVDTGSARLWAIDGKEVAATMKVIVGKKGSETPPMAAFLRFALINPYWDIPPDLVSRDVAPQAARRGQPFFDERGYEVVDAYGPAPRKLDAAAVDWNAVRNGSARVGVRQKPGPTNTMGRVLFMFPNRWGIYLHDTPGRQNFARADRGLSNGCVRLERAGELYRWAFGRELPWRSVGADQRVYLAEPIPVFLLEFSPAASAVLSSNAHAGLEAQRT